MDPLSITASIITVLSAARKAGQGLQKIKALKDAPKELDNLLAEFSRIEAVLRAFQNLPTSVQERVPGLVKILRDAKEKFDELDSLIHYVLTTAGENDRVDRLQWVRKRHDAERLRGQLNEIQATLNTLLNTTNSTTLHEVSLVSHQLLDERRQSRLESSATSSQLFITASQVIERFEESRATQLELVRLLGHVRETSLAPQSSIQGPYSRSITAPSDNKEVAVPAKNLKPRMRSKHECHIRVSRPSRTHRRDCPCTCHRYRNRTKIYRPWSSVLDLGFVVVESGPDQQACDVQCCKQATAPYLEVKYILPTWFMFRMISVLFTSSPLYGPELLLRVPCVLPWPNDNGSDWRPWEKHFEKWLSIPYHLDERGRSLVQVALAYDQYDVLKRLVDMHVDLYQQVDSSGLNGLGVLWKHVESTIEIMLIGQEMVQDMHFGDYAENRGLDKLLIYTVEKMDWGDYAEDRGLNELHRIVTGMSARDLSAHAGSHPEDINGLDIDGRSPLWYASRFANFEHTCALLRFGADQDQLHSNMFRSTMLDGRADWFQGLLDLGLTLTGPRVKDLGLLWQRSLQWDNEAGCLAVDKLVLEQGIDVNYVDDDGKTLLMNCVRSQTKYRVARLKQLLEHGANVRLVDEEGMTALHHLMAESDGSHFDVEAFEMLVKYGSSLNKNLIDGSTVLHLAIHFTTSIELIEAMAQSDVSSLDLAATNDRGYTALDILILRAGILREHLKENWQALNRLKYIISLQYRRFFIRQIRSPEEENKVLQALHALLHRIQELQGVPAEARYPALDDLLDDPKHQHLFPIGSESDAEDESNTEALEPSFLPGAWID